MKPFNSCGRDEKTMFERLSCSGAIQGWREIFGVTLP
jgi:hypothetical protein